MTVEHTPGCPRDGESCFACLHERIDRAAVDTTGFLDMTAAEPWEIAFIRASAVFAMGALSGVSEDAAWKIAVESTDIELDAAQRAKFDDAVRYMGKPSERISRRLGETDAEFRDRIKGVTR